MSKRAKLSDNSQQKTTPLWIQETSDQVLKHEQALVATTVETKTLLATLKSQLDERAKRWIGEIDSYNDAIGKIQNQFKSAISAFSESNTIVFSWFRKTEDILVDRLYIVAIISIIVVLLYSYLAYSVISLATLVASVLFGATMIGVIYASTRYLRSKMDQHLTCVKSSENGLAKEKLVFNQRFRPSEISLSDILKSIVYLEQKDVKIQTTIPLFLSSNKHLTELDEILKRQRQTAANMKSALQIYGVLLTEECEKYLSNFHATLQNDSAGVETVQEQAWVVQIADFLATPLALSPDVLQLLYYNFRVHKLYRSASWKAVKVNEKSLKQLAVILIKDMEKLDPAVTILRDFQEDFDNASFHTLYSKYNRESFEIKNSVILAVEKLGLDIVSPHRTSMSRFVPTSSDRENILSEVLDIASRLFGIDVQTLRLIYLETCLGNDDPSTVEYWKDFKNSDELLKKLSDSLFRGQQSRLPKQYLDETKKDEILQSVRKDIKTWKQYSTKEASGLILYLVETVDQMKTDLKRAIEDFKFALKLDDNTQFDSYIPERNDLVGNLAKKLSELLVQSEDENLDYRIIKLFYYHKLDSTAQKDAFSELKDVGLMLKLATILLSHGVIRREQGTDLAAEAKRVCSILQSEYMKRLDLVDLQSLYQAFGEIDLLTERLLNLLVKEGVVEQTAITFDNLLNLFADLKIKQQERLSRLETVCMNLLENHCLITFGKDDYKPVILSISCLFLDTQQDTLSGEACIRASSNDFAVKILYHYIKLTREETAKTSKTGKILARAIIEVKKDQTIQYEFLKDFKTALANRQLFHDFDSLVSARFHIIHQEMQKKINQLQAEYNEQREAEREFLEVNLSLDQLSFAVDSQLIQPYMITVNEHAPMLSKIIDDKMKGLCQAMIPNDESYKDFLLLTEETERSAAGYFTRTGLVPIGMNFSEFSEKFMTLYGQATDEYLKESNKLDEKWKYSANIFRIQLSSLGFKRLEGKTEKEHEHPIKAIQRIIASKMGKVASFSLAASLQSGESPNNASRIFIVQMYDNTASVFKQIEPRIGKLLEDYKGLEHFLQDKDQFDKRLFGSFKCKKFVDFAIAMQNAKRDLGSDDKLTSQITDSLSTILPKHFKMKLEDVQQIAKVVVKKFAYYGGVLRN